MRKKVKASKLAIDSIILTEVDLHDIGETVCDVTGEAIQEYMTEQQTVLGGPKGAVAGVTGAAPAGRYLVYPRRSRNDSSRTYATCKDGKYDSIARWSISLGEHDGSDDAQYDERNWP